MAKLRCEKCGNKKKFRRRVNYPFGRKSSKRITWECKICGAYVSERKKKKSWKVNYEEN